MKSKLMIFAAFAVGAALGSVVTWKCVEKKYERIAREEIESVKETFSRRLQEEKEKIEHDIPKGEVCMEEYCCDRKLPPLEDEEEEDDHWDDVREPVEYVEILKSTGYSASADAGDVKKPYVISPEEFMEYEDYNTISLMFYADHIVAYADTDDVVEDLDGLIGFDALNHFGEYEDDSVYVRNDRLKCDIEILLSLRKYSEVLEEKPYKKREL